MLFGRFPTLSLKEISGIARRCKARWRVGLFFCWIKQPLRIKTFYGTSENAAKTQIWTAISAYVLVAILKKQLGLDLSLYTILQILNLALFEKNLDFSSDGCDLGD